MVYSSVTYEVLRYCQFIGITNVVDRKQNFALHVKPSSQAFHINTCLSIEEFVIVQIATSRTIGKCVKRNSILSQSYFWCLVFKIFGDNLILSAEGMRKQK